MIARTVPTSLFFQCSFIPSRSLAYLASASRVQLQWPRYDLINAALLRAEARRGRGVMDQIIATTFKRKLKLVPGFYLRVGAESNNNLAYGQMIQLSQLRDIMF